MAKREPEKIEAMLKEARNLLAQLDDVLVELGKVSRSAPTFEDVVGEVRKVFLDAWQAHYQSLYQWNYTREEPLLRKAVKAIGVPGMYVRIRGYFLDRDDYLLRRRHEFPVFIAGINRYGAPMQGRLTGDVVGCRHTPPCQSDAEHTDKMLVKPSA